MIVKMKKAFIFVQAKDAPEAIEGLRKLGIVHVEHIQPPAGKDITLLQEDLALVSDALRVLVKEDLCPPETKIKEKPVFDRRHCSSHIIDLDKRIDRLQEYAADLTHEIAQWEAWGDFDPLEIQQLAEKNIFIRFYQIPEKELKTLPENISVKKIFSRGNIAHCLIISRGRQELAFKEIALPKLGPLQMRKRLEEDKRTLESLKKELCAALAFKRPLAQEKETLEKELEFRQALSGMGGAGALAYLSGYLPGDNAAKLLERAKKEKWGVFITEPASEDNVPVLLRNSKLVALINPIFKLMEVVPGYRELDVSPLFLLFLSLFFGMIIGDAGYGAVFFLITFFAQRKSGVKVKDKSVFFLFYLFSACAILWGLLTGTVFGQQWYLAAGFKPFFPLLNEAKFLMSFCFFLGALQLSLAHGWQAVIKLPSLSALADAGFICLLWAGFFLAKMFIIGEAFPFFGKWLIWAGVLLIIFFSYPQKNIFKAAASGLGVLALGAMGNFGDVVSYIRLFAVGLAGVAVADSVNTLAAGSGNIIAQVIILFIGHAINIVLGPISVLVHGIRLNVLEFSLLHGNVTWSGLAYKPLKT